MLHKETEGIVEGMGDGGVLSGRPERSSHWGQGGELCLSTEKQGIWINLGYGQVEDFIVYPLNAEEFG